MHLSSISKEGLVVRLGTEYSPSHREVFAGRATLIMETGISCLQLYPTAAELRELAGELLTAADRVDPPKA
jgi:hypothetical protein